MKSLKLSKILAKLRLDGRLCAQLFRFCFENFPEFREKKRFLAATFANCRSWIKCGLFFSCSPHTSFDEINYSVVKYERGKFGTSSDPPLVYSAHSTAGDLWRAPIRHLLQTHLAAGVKKIETKTLYRLPTGERENSERMCPKTTALSPTLMWPCPERRTVTTGCLHLEM